LKKNMSVPPPSIPLKVGPATRRGRKSTTVFGAQSGRCRGRISCAGAGGRGSILALMTPVAHPSILLLRRRGADGEGCQQGSCRRRKIGGPRGESRIPPGAPRAVSAPKCVFRPCFPWDVCGLSAFSCGKAG
jgi:hypothetical protein